MDATTELPYNEPAFPHESPNQIFAGMTLRDYFAAAYLTGLAARYCKGTPEQDAEDCYMAADAMLRERAK